MLGRRYVLLLFVYVAYRRGKFREFSVNSTIFTGLENRPPIVHSPVSPTWIADHFWERAGPVTKAVERSRAGGTPSLAR